MCQHLPLATINGRAIELAELMSRDDKLAFEPWETRLLPRIAQSQPGNVVALSDDTGELVAGVVGGRCGVRGTISHAWVRPDSRGRRIGDKLALSAAEELARAGAEVIHLMVTEGNDEAVNFWERLGFTRVVDRVTLECDIADEEFVDGLFETLHPADTSTVTSDPEAAARLAAFLEHHAVGFVARDESGICGFVAVGSLGVRGLIEECWANSVELGVQLIRHAFAWLLSHGVARAHAFVHASHPRLELLERCGMRQITGETTLEYVPVRCAG